MTVIVLHKDRPDTGIGKCTAMPGLEEMPAHIAEDSRLDQYDFGQSRGLEFHYPRSLSSASRYAPYSVLRMGWASSSSCAAPMKPARNAISSGQHTFQPWRFSIASINIEACSK